LFLPQVLWPEYDYSFDLIGAPELTAALQTARQLLGGHLLAAIVCSAALAAFAWARPGRAPLCAVLLLVLKAVHGAVAAVACHLVPALWGWLQVLISPLSSKSFLPLFSSLLDFIVIHDLASENPRALPTPGFPALPFSTLRSSAAFRI
jgi:hypothetical protein